MTRISLLRSLSYLCILLLVFSVPVLADEESYTFGGKGLVDYVKDYFTDEDDIESIPSPNVSVIDKFEEASPGVALMSVSPEDIINGALTFSYSSIIDATQSSAGYASTTSSDAMNSVRTSSLGTVLRDDQPTTYTDTILVRSSDVIVDKGEIFDFSLSGIVNYWDATKITNSGQAVFDYFCEDLEAIDLSVNLVLKDVGSQSIDTSDIVFTVDSSGRYYYISMSVKNPLEHDLLGIDIVMKYDVQDAFGMPAEVARAQSTNFASYNPHHTVGFYNAEFLLSVLDQTNGLLSGIIGWLQGIWEGITSLPGKIVDGIKSLMISLFVPSDSFFEECFDRFDYVFKDRLGFMYTALSYIIDFYYNLIDYWEDGGMEQEYIEFPQVSIPVSDDVDFVFGGWSVKVIPEGFEGFADILKMVVNIICTIYMIITSWRYFEKLIDGGARS